MPLDMGAETGAAVEEQFKGNIILVGFMGTGKSVTGKLLARRLGRQFVDTDCRIRDVAGMSIPEIFAHAGETGFRECEAAVLEEVCRLREAVISTGGGILGRDENLRLLQSSGVLICLQARPEVILRRTKPWDGRPMLQTAANPREAIERLLRQRQPQYARADWSIDTSELEPEQVVEKICENLPSIWESVATRF